MQRLESNSHWRVLLSAWLLQGFPSLHLTLMWNLHHADETPIYWNSICSSPPAVSLEHRFLVCVPLINQIRIMRWTTDHASDRSFMCTSTLFLSWVSTFLCHLHLMECLLHFGMPGGYGTRDTAFHLDVLTCCQPSSCAKMLSKFSVDKKYLRLSEASPESSSQDTHPTGQCRLLANLILGVRS
jgi:hypothetical protein